jgi:hypothetical protein
MTTKVTKIDIPSKPKSSKNDSEEGEIPIKIAPEPRIRLIKMFRLLLTLFYGQFIANAIYSNIIHGLPQLIENDFTNPTSILDDYFTEVFGVFKSTVSKASLLDLRPLGWLGSHVDFPYYKTVRLHASISGNENAWYEVNGERFQLPADGNWYFIDTGKYHSIWNNGPSSRITLNVNLTVEEDPKILALAGRL